MATLILTRTPEDNRLLTESLSSRGLDIIHYPCVDFRMLPFAGGDVAGHPLASFAAAVFTSRRGVAGVADVARQFRKAGMLIGAVGRGTASAVEEVFGRSPDVVSREGTGADLGRRLAETIPACSRVLHVRGAMTTGHLRGACEVAGLALTPLVVYENVSPDLERLAVQGRCAAVFASPSAVTRFLSVNPDLAGEMFALAVGPTTAQALKEHGVGRVAVAAEPTNEALIQCVDDLIARWSDE